MKISSNLTIANIRSAYTEEAKANDMFFGLWRYYVLRKASFYLAWFFIKFGISANQISMMDISCMVVGCVLVALGNYGTILAGALLLNFYLLLDMVDGTVARFTKTAGGKLGMFFEWLSAIFDQVLLFTCVGIGAFFNPGFFLGGVNRWIFIGVGIFASLCQIITPHITAFIERPQTAHKFNVDQGRKSLMEERNLLGKVSTYRIIKGLFGSTYLFALAIAAVSNALGIYLLVFTFIFFMESVLKISKTYIIQRVKVE